MILDKDSWLPHARRHPQIERDNGPELVTCPATWPDGHPASHADRRGVGRPSRVIARTLLLLTPCSPRGDTARPPTHVVAGHGSRAAGYGIPGLCRCPGLRGSPNSPPVSGRRGVVTWTRTARELDALAQRADALQQALALTCPTVGDRWSPVRRPRSSTTGSGLPVVTAENPTPKKPNSHRGTLAPTGDAQGDGRPCPCRFGSGH